jgi:hypothetical protein
MASTARAIIKKDDFHSYKPNKSSKKRMKNMILH